MPIAENPSLRRLLQIVGPAAAVWLMRGSSVPNAEVNVLQCLRPTVATSAVGNPRTKVFRQSSVPNAATGLTIMMFKSELF